jgi:DNA-binding response OmpR family regulator
MKVLLIEDNEEISAFIKCNLLKDGITVETAFDGVEGSYRARTSNYDIIIIDFSLPIKTGLLVCEEIRTAKIHTPIIFLTIHNEIDKKVSALEKGADDYIIKPFSFEELKARMSALLRRPVKIQNELLAVDDLVLDTHKKVVKRGKNQIYLTRKTYNLLEFLLKNRGTVLSRGAILEHVWNSESDPFSNTVEAHIRNLRKKIHVEGKRDLVRNIPGRGYVID